MRADTRRGMSAELGRELRSSHGPQHRQPTWAAAEARIESRRGPGACARAGHGLPVAQALELVAAGSWAFILESARFASWFAVGCRGRGWGSGATGAQRRRLVSLTLVARKLLVERPLGAGAAHGGVLASLGVRPHAEVP
jgi:hypothetical protein